MHEKEIALKRPFPVQALSWRVGSTNSDKTKGMMLAYIDARDVMKRLDQVLGFDGWRDEYREVMGRVICRLWVRVDGEWTFREDGAGNTDTEGEKGGISDAFKRAAVKWGIGRYLYELPSPWIEIKPAGRSHAPADKDWFRRPNVFQMPDWATPEGFDRWLANEDYPELVKKYADSIDSIKQGIAEGRMSSAAEAWFEIPETARNGLWRAPSKGGCFTTQERAAIQSSEFRESYFGVTTESDK